MQKQPVSRRSFVKMSAATATLAIIRPVGTVLAEEDKESKLHVAVNQYAWNSYMQREGKNFAATLDVSVPQIARTGIDGLEPLSGNPAYFEQLAPLMKQAGLEMRSIYQGCSVHTPELAEKSIETLLAAAAKAKELAGTKLMVSNPQPMRGREKTDEELTCQADALNRLGQGLHKLDMGLSYHFHAPELRSNGRELHAMMKQTDPALVSLCLDTHWVYRGMGNSASAVYEFTEQYADRVSELHLRQSSGGTWTEAFGKGDIDYTRVAKILAEKDVLPHYVLEQAVENGSPKTMSVVEAMTQSRQAVEKLFG